MKMTLDKLKKIELLSNSNIRQIVDKKTLKIIEKNVEKSMEGLLTSLMINWKDDHNMKDTPKRVAKMLIHETFRGRYYPMPKVTDFPNVTNHDQLYAVGPIDVKSTCAHHLQPFYGKAWVGILPAIDEKKKSKIIGLSKFNRVVDHFARRPQIQEELTSQIANELEAIINPSGLIVMVKCHHLCMLCRGVNQPTKTVTSIARGELRENQSIKSEFFQMIGNTEI